MISRCLGWTIYNIYTVENPFHFLEYENFILWNKNPKSLANIDPKVDDIFQKYFNNFIKLFFNKKI